MAGRGNVGSASRGQRLFFAEDRVETEIFEMEEELCERNMLEGKHVISEMTHEKKIK